MQRTRHPNIVRFFGTGLQPDGQPFLVEELMPMGSLQRILWQQRQRHNDGSATHVNSRLSHTQGGAGHGEASEAADDLGGPPVVLTWALKTSLAVDVARGMAHIHSLGHLHRDLKSGNVLVTHDLQARPSVFVFGSINRWRLSTLFQHLLVARPVYRCAFPVSGRQTTYWKVVIGVTDYVRAGKGCRFWLCGPDPARGTGLCPQASRQERQPWRQTVPYQPSVGR